MQTESTYPTTATHQFRRGEIIAAAIAVINAKGYAAASISKIAKQANTSKSTVLYHFASKQELLLAVVGSLYEDGAAYIKPRIDAATSTPKKLAVYIESNIAFIAMRTAQIAAINAISSEAAPSSYQAESVQLLQHMFEVGQADGVFGDFDAKHMAVILRQVIDAASVYILSNPTVDPAKYGESISTIFAKATSPGVSRE